MKVSSQTIDVRIRKEKAPFPLRELGLGWSPEPMWRSREMNTFPAYRVQLYIENDWQVRDERAAHSIIKLLAKSLHSHPRLNVLSTG
ncbi:hypothetical protein AL552_12340 [Vibrio diabolicus]|nr:hypothetical protein AL537_08665 [Vibrio diabolicus]MDU9592197.1 hypothetical protein [Vibrio sp. 2-1-2a]MDU9602064.1 hypothetical protein [Vibrio sp. 1-2-3a]MPS38540.1 hypothetical protein [Vibrio sp. VGrn 2]AVF94524.1 hypothetical protein AL552_12340 [Vibrio diabolicus]